MAARRHGYRKDSLLAFLAEHPAGRGTTDNPSGKETDGD